MRPLWIEIKSVTEFAFLEGPCPLSGSNLFSSNKKFALAFHATLQLYSFLSLMVCNSPVFEKKK